MRMKRTSVPLEEVIPVMAVKDGCIISRRGEVTVGWEVTLPTMYGISEEEYDDIIGSYASSMRILPLWTVVHRQDVYTYGEYHAKPSEGYLRQSYENHFDGRKYLKHRQFLYVTMSSKGSVTKSHSTTAAFGIKYNAKTPSFNEVRAFVSKAEEFAIALSSSGRMALRRLTNEEIEGSSHRKGLLDSYLDLFSEGPLQSDIPMSGDYLQVGDREVLGFVISEADKLQGEIRSVGRVESLCGPSSEIILSAGSALGPLLDCEHIVNHVIAIPQQSFIMQELDRKRKKNTSMSTSSAENRVMAEEIGNYLDDVHRDSLTSVFAHMNVIAWGKKDEIDVIRGKVSAALTMSGITAVQELHGLPVLWISGFPGGAAELGRQNLMIMELDSALCMGIYDTYEKDIEGGLFTICDRVRNIPLTIDVQKLARDKGLIDNYNAFVLGPSGTGKSFFMNYYLRNCYDAGEEIFIIDVGDSYEGLCEIIREESGGKDGIYHSWDTSHPFSFNPFDGYEDWLSADGTSLKMDSNGATFFLSFLQTLWAPDGGWTPSSIPVLRQTVVDFLNMAKTAFVGTRKPIFDDYFRFLKSAISPAVEGSSYIVGDEPVGIDRFDIKDFRLSLIPYAKGGEFEFLLNDTEGKDLFSSRFTVFEVDILSQVEDQKFYSLCVLCIMNAFDTKMRKSKNFKIMVIEEAWKAIANETMAPYLKGLWKTARKFQTSAMVVTQDIGDVTSSEVIKDAILNNSAIKFLLNQTSNQNNFDTLTKLLGLGPREKNLILSMDRANNSAYRYREVFIKWNNRCGVYATEASPHEALAYESDKVRKAPIYELARQCGGLREAISTFINKMRS